MEITINQNENQLISINNQNIQDISINQNDSQLLTIETPTTPEIDISQLENQTIYINGGGIAIGVTDVLVNGVTVVSNGIAYVVVPTKTSELTNNSGFITNETDPTVPTVVKQITLADINNWNSKQDRLVSGSTIKTVNNQSLLGSGNINIEGTTYTAGNGISIENNIITNEITNYNDLSDLPDIPTKTSDLLNDSEFVTEDELSEVAFTGSYSSLSDTPVIPDSTSELTNDSDFITGAEVSTELATKQDVLVSGTNIKTINNTSLLGSGNINISGGGTATDVQINGTSIVNNDVANIITESAYNSSTNKIATKSDIPTTTSALTNDSNYVTLLDVYPIGSIYMSANSTSPSTLFGGTWVQIEDKFLLSAGNTYTAGSTGGSNETENHILTIDEIPSHRHKTVISSGGTETLDGYSSYSYTNTSRFYNNTSYVGGGQGHKHTQNLPPYLVVYVWKRTA